MLISLIFKNYFNITHNTLYDSEIQDYTSSAICCHSHLQGSHSPPPQSPVLSPYLVLSYPSPHLADSILQFDFSGLFGLVLSDPLSYFSVFYMCMKPLSFRYMKSLEDSSSKCEKHTSRKDLRSTLCFLIFLRGGSGVGEVCIYAK